MTNVINFPGKRENEEIKITIKKSWMADITTYAYLLIWSFVFVWLYTSIISSKIILFSNNQYKDYLLSFIIIAYSIFLIMMFIRWLDNTLDAMIVTSERIITINQSGMFSRDINEISLDNIENLRIKTDGWWNTVTRMGGMYIHTASDEGTIYMDQIFKPSIYTAKILEIKDEYLNRQEHEKAAILRDEVYGIDISEKEKIGIQISGNTIDISNV